MCEREPSISSRNKPCLPSDNRPPTCPTLRPAEPQNARAPRRPPPTPLSGDQGRCIALSSRRCRCVSLHQGGVSMSHGNTHARRARALLVPSGTLITTSQGLFSQRGIISSQDRAVLSKDSLPRTALASAPGQTPPLPRRTSNRRQPSREHAHAWSRASCRTGLWRPTPFDKLRQIPARRPHAADTPAATSAILQWIDCVQPGGPLQTVPHTSASRSKGRSGGVGTSRWGRCRKAAKAVEPPAGTC
jgi:hypothetical protein